MSQSIDNQKNQDSPAGNTETPVGQDGNDANGNVNSDETSELFKSVGVSNAKDLVKAYRESRKGMTQAFQDKSSIELELEKTKSELNDKNSLVNDVVNYHKGKTNTSLELDEYIQRQDQAREAERKRMDANRIAINDAKVKGAETTRLTQQLMKSRYPDDYTDETKAVVDGFALAELKASPHVDPVVAYETAIDRFLSFKKGVVSNHQSMEENRDSMGEKAAQLPGSTGRTNKETLTKNDGAFANFDTKAKREAELDRLSVYH